MSIYREFNVDLEQIKELMQSLQESKLNKLVVKSGEFELSLEKNSETASSIQQLPPVYRPPLVEASQADPYSVRGNDQVNASSSESRSAVEIKGKYVTSPMVGTYYASSSPETPPFVKVGDRVEENTVVCIVEAMKVMNEVKAGVSGTVSEILVQNAAPVEFGAKILRIE